MLESTLSPLKSEVQQPGDEPASGELKQLTDEEVRVLRFCLAWVLAHFGAVSREPSTPVLLPPLIVRSMRTARDILVKLDRRLPPHFDREEAEPGAWGATGPGMAHEGEGEHHCPGKGDGQVHDHPTTAGLWSSSEVYPVP